MIDNFPVVIAWVLLALVFRVYACRPLFPIRLTPEWRERKKREAARTRNRTELVGTLELTELDRLLESSESFF